jgi:hypothetical protein
MGFDEMKAECDKRAKAFDDAFKNNKKLERGLVSKKVFRIQVADGYAVYEVVRVGPRQTTVKYREDCVSDDYMDRVLGRGGSFPTKVIEGIVVPQNG